MFTVLKARPGFTLAEVIVALTMTAVIGAAVTGVFISQSTFFDHQEKVGSARGVTRGATNMIMSELRMLEVGAGIVDATSTSITARVPIGMGLICRAGNGLTISRLPTDPSVLADSSTLYGYAYLRANGTYEYVEPVQPLGAGPAFRCSDNNVRVMPGGTVDRLVPIPTTTPVDTGGVVMLYQLVIYEFKASKAVPGRLGLFRTVDMTHRGKVNVDEEEELVTPFDDTARFRFYVSDGASAQDDVPGALSDITGLELILDGLSERPDGDGSHRSVPSVTSVFFKNR